MIRTLSVIFFVCAQAAIGAAAATATCSGANPAITAATVKNVTSNGSLSVYHIEGTVTNLGAAGQPSNTLQFVDIYTSGEREDAKTIPPLAAGQSAPFTYDWQRSSAAGQGTTTMSFRIRMRQGTDCNPANGNYSITF